MSTALERRLGGLAIVALATLGVVVVVGTGAVARGLPDAGTYLSTALDVVHLLGLGASLLLAYYALGARRRFAGGALGESAGYTAVGAVAFAVAFFVMELDHGLGIDVLAGVGDPQLAMAISMFLFTGTTIAFGWAFGRFASVLGGTES